MEPWPCSSARWSLPSSKARSCIAAGCGDAVAGSVGRGLGDCCCDGVRVCGDASAVRAWLRCRSEPSALNTVTAQTGTASSATAAATTLRRPRTRRMSANSAPGTPRLPVAHYRLGAPREANAKRAARPASRPATAIPMTATRITNRAEPRASLPRRALALDEPTCLRLVPPREPMPAGAARRVGILDHEGARASFGRRRGPLERRRYILALARVTPRERRAVLERRVTQRERGHGSGL